MLITVEGLDGSGKSTAVDALREDLTHAVFTQEPTTTWYGDAVRRSVENDAADPLAELFLYTADHAAHLAQTVRPALERGALVVSDRYSDSRYAYQSASLEHRLENPLRYIRDVHRPWTRPPDATVYLDVDPETGAERSGATNKFETIEFLERVQSYYELLIDREPERFTRIDATQSRARVADAVTRVVQDLGGEADGA